MHAVDAYLSLSSSMFSLPAFGENLFSVPPLSLNRASFSQQMGFMLRNFVEIKKLSGAIFVFKIGLRIYFSKGQCLLFPHAWKRLIRFKKLCLYFSRAAEATGHGQTLLVSKHLCTLEK